MIMEEDISKHQLFSGKDCFTKVTPNDDNDIWTPSPGVLVCLDIDFGFGTIKGTVFKDENLTSTANWVNTLLMGF